MYHMSLPRKSWSRRPMYGGRPDGFPEFRAGSIYAGWRRLACTLLAAAAARSFCGGETK